MAFAIGENDCRVAVPALHEPPWASLRRSAGSFFFPPGISGAMSGLRSTDGPAATGVPRSHRLVEIFTMLYLRSFGGHRCLPSESSEVLKKIRTRLCALRCHTLPSPCHSRCMPTIHFSTSLTRLKRAASDLHRTLRSLHRLSCKESSNARHSIKQKRQAMPRWSQCVL